MSIQEIERNYQIQHLQPQAQTIISINGRKPFAPMVNNNNFHNHFQVWNTNIVITIFKQRLCLFNAYSI